MNIHITRTSVLSIVFTVAILGVTGFFAMQLFNSAPVAEAAFVCPADTECPYDSDGNFIGYKNTWPYGCQTILPGAKSNPALNMYNPLDLRSSTTAPQCYPTNVSAFGFTYYGRGHRMRNIGTYIDRNGCAQKFNADGSFLATECFPGTRSNPTDTTITYGATTPTVLTAATTATTITTILSPESSFKYANSDVVYYLTRNSCKEQYGSAAVLAAWGVTPQNVVTVADSVQYPMCGPAYVRAPHGSVITADGVAMYLVQYGSKRVFTNYQSFVAQGYSVDRALRVSQAELDAYPTGASIK